MRRATGAGPQGHLQQAGGAGRQFVFGIGREAHAGALIGHREIAAGGKTIDHMIVGHVEMIGASVDVGDVPAVGSPLQRSLHEYGAKPRHFA